VNVGQGVNCNYLFEEMVLGDTVAEVTTGLAIYVYLVRVCSGKGTVVRNVGIVLEIQKVFCS